MSTIFRVLAHPNRREKYISAYFLFVFSIQLLIIYVGSAVEAPMWYFSSGIIVLICLYNLNYRRLPFFFFIFFFYILTLGVLRSYSMGIEQILGTVLFLSAFSAFFWINSDYFFRWKDRSATILAYSGLSNVASFLVVSCIAQWLIFYFWGVSSYGDSINTRGSGGGAQLTGIFKEPALLGSVCSVLLMYFLYLSPERSLRKTHYVRVVSLILLIFLSRSLSGLLLLTVVVLPLFARLQARQLLLLVLIVTPALLFFGDQQLSRVQSELIPIFNSLNNSSDDIFASSSSYRLAGEFYFLQRTIEQAPLFGFGIDYGDFNNYVRVSSLNVFTEIVIRWGIVGLVLFLATLLNLASRLPDTYCKFRFLLFVVGFFFVDAAIAKSLFWIILGIAYYSSMVMKNDN